MSQSTTNNAYMEKSMNGIISIDDGAGTIIENGVVSCLELDVPRINVDQIESRTVGANVSMFTELVGGSIHLANGATTLFVDAPTTVSTVNITNLNATNISTNNIVAAVPTNTANLFANQTTGLINFATGRTSGTVNLGSNAATGSFNIRNGGITNIGAFSSSLTMGSSQTALQTVYIGNLGITYIRGSELNVYANMYVNNINASTSSSTGNLFTNVSTGTINIGTQMYTSGIINLGYQSIINCSQSTLKTRIVNCSIVQSDELEFEIYGTNVSVYTQEFGANIQMGNVSNTLNIYSPVNTSTINVSTIRTNLINSFDTALPSALFPNALTDVSIADGLTSGILSMGSLLQVGEINIGGSNANGGSINIGREMNGGTMRFASSAQATSIYWGNDANTGTINFNTNTSMILGPYAKTITIGSNQFLSTDRINIGNGTTGSASMNLLCRNTINIGLNASSIQIGNSMTTGNINLGSNAITTTIKGATINMGTDTSINAINIGNVSTTQIIVGTNSGSGNITLRTLGALSLGNSAATIELGIGTSVTNTITIGNASSTVNISGSASISGNTYTATAVGSTVNLFNNLTTGSLNMATGITNGNILIGSHSTIGATGSLTLRAKNSVEIGSAAASIYLGIGSPSINIGTSIVGGTPSIDIGTAAYSTINLNGNFGVAIKPTYAYTAFVGTPTGCIGNFFIPTTAISSNFTLVSGANKVGGTFTNLPIGVWMLYWNCAVYSPTTVAGLTSITLMMGTTSGGSDLFSGVVDIGNVPVGITKTYLITQIYSNTNATTDIYFSITAVFTGTLSLLPLYSIKDCKVLRLA